MQHTSKDALLSSETDNVFTDSLAQCFSTFFLPCPLSLIVLCVKPPANEQVV